jgi:hypothetical protein
VTALVIRRPTPVIVLPKRAFVRSRNRPGGETADLDWTLLFRAFLEAFEWTLDVARGFARDFPEEVAAVERVRTFMRRRVSGQVAHVRLEDVLFTFGLIMGAIERDLGPLRRTTPAEVAKRARIATAQLGMIPG